MSKLPQKVLVIDDDPAVTKGVANELGRHGITTLTAHDLNTSIYLFNQNRFDVVLIELEFGPLPGLALVQKFRGHEVFDKACTGIIIMAGKGRNSEDDGLIKELGDIEIVAKPFSAIQALTILTKSFASKKMAIDFANNKSTFIDSYVKRGEFGKAIDHVKGNLGDYGEKGFDILTDLYERDSQFDDALALISRRLEKNANSISLLNTKGRILMKMGKFKEAALFLEKADKLAPQNIERINDMATMYLEMSRPEDSIAKMKQAIALAPEDPDKKFGMFAKLYEYGYDEEALRLGKETTKPMEIVRHYNNKGVLLSKQDKVGDALIEYERALKFYPKFKENYRIHFNIALAQINIKTKESYELAKSALEHCLKLQPGFEKAIKALETVETLLEANSKKNAS